MTAKLYSLTLSHPSHAARKMLDLKGIDHEVVTVLPGFQRVHVRLAGFRGGTVPALKLDGRRIQGSRVISRELDRLVAHPPLFPSDPQLRARVEEAERWGEEEFQPVPRRITRWGLVHDLDARMWLAREARFPAPALTARLSGGNARYYARLEGASDAAVRHDLERLHANLDRVDALLADGTLSLEPPNAATLQVLATVRALAGLSDLTDAVSAHACAAPARALFDEFPGPLPRFLAPGMLAAIEARG